MADVRNATGFKEKCINFIANNMAEVNETQEWKQLINDQRSDLMGLVIQAMCNRE